MKLQALMIVLLAGVLGHGAAGQSAATKVERTTLCNIVNHPSDFIGKKVEIRAQIWTDNRYPDSFWMNESSIQFNTVCRFLHATFTQDSGLYGQTAFGTFRGRIVKKQSLGYNWTTSIPKGLGIIFVVDQASDIYLRRDYLSGPIPRLQLYDPKTASIVRPDN